MKFENKHLAYTKPNAISKESRERALFLTLFLAFHQSSLWVVPNGELSILPEHDG